MTDAEPSDDRQRVANIWNRLHERVRKDKPDFRFLSFKHIRKTASQFIRDTSDGETTGVFLSHGTPVESDELLDEYTRRNFTRVADALSKVREHLAPMFAAAPDAFTQPRKKGGANISLGTIEHIQRLLRDGVEVPQVAEIVGVSRPTVYRYAWQGGTLLNTT